jgi:hypothetical protein
MFEQEGVVTLAFRQAQRQIQFRKPRPAVFEQEEDPANKSFFSEIISSVSSVRYNPQGTQLISRDYLTVKLWDVRNEKAPVHTFTVWIARRTIDSKGIPNQSFQKNNIFLGKYTNM